MYTVCLGVLVGAGTTGFFLFFTLFIYFWLHWVFVAVRGLSLVAVSRGHSSLQCVAFSLRWLLLWWSTGSRCAGFGSCGSRTPERRLSSYGARAQLLCSMWDLPGPGLEPMSPALAGGFSTTAPSGKPEVPSWSIIKNCSQKLVYFTERTDHSLVLPLFRI